MKYGLYIHVPYCKSKCRYCDFYTRGACKEVPEEYVQAVIREFLRMAPKDAFGNRVAPSTVYFGGGTPGLLRVEQVQQLLDIFAPEEGAEITLETNPETTDEEKLRGWLAAGVNRLSVGLQTAYDNSLRTLGRLHTAQQAKEILQLAKQVGFTNITGDIMLALPSYSNAEFDASLALLQEAGVSHISAYILKIEEGTPFGKKPPEHLPSADEAADFYTYAVEQLEQAGYLQYEISNFAQTGFEGKHNLFYWDCENYLGIGPAAHSCMNGKRFYYGESTQEFIADTLTVVQDGTCDWQDYVMLQLRLKKGLNLLQLEEKFGKVFSQEQKGLMQKYETMGLCKKTSTGWALTAQGLLVENVILVELLEA